MSGESGGKIARGRVIPAPAGSTVHVHNTHDSGTSTLPRGRILAPAVAAAHEEAKAIRARAAEEARREVAREVDSRVAAALLSVRAEEERRAERDLQRATDTAVALAEHLLHAELTLSPDRIVDLARRALAEARGARKVTIEANPLDAGPLRAQLEEIGLPIEAIAIEERADLARGDLMLRTNLGTLDARLNPQLERLAAALAQAGRA